MQKFNTGNKDLDQWLDYYHTTDRSSTKFLYLIKKLDKTFLMSCPPVDIENELNDYIPEYGLLDIDFRKVAFDSDTDDFLSEYIRIVASILNNVNLDKFKDRYKEEFNEIMEKSLIEGDYEKYGIEFEKVIAIAFQKKYINRSDLMALSLLRGLKFGKLYPEKVDLKNLKYTVIKNNLKKLLHI